MGICPSREKSKRFIPRILEVGARVRRGGRALLFVEIVVLDLNLTPSLTILRIS